MRFFSCLWPKSTTAKLLLIYGIQSIGGGISFYIALFLKTNTFLTPLLISTVISASAIGNMLGSYLGGYLSDKYQPAYGLKIGLGIQGFALLSLVFMTQFYSILLIMTLMGMGSYLYITSSNYVLTSKFNTCHTNRVKIISNQHIISNIGMFLSAILMGYCAAGYYLPIFITLALCLLGIALGFRPFDKAYYETTRQEKTKNQNIKRNTLYYVTGLLAIALIGMMYAQLKMGYPVFLASKFGAINTGYLMSMNPLIILLCQRTIIKNTSQWNEIVALGLGLLLLGISFLMLSISANQAMIFLSSAVMTVGEILAFTYAQSLSFGYAPERSRGRILGLYKSIYSLTKIMGAYVAGGLIYYTNYNVLWYFSGSLGLLGFCMAIFVLAKRHTNTTSEEFGILGGN